MDRFPVVGVGASAGGLDAYTRFLRNLSPTTGMAYVLVQHLDPHHQSHLTELLSKGTSMPVVEVQDEQPVEPNRIYVIPHNRLLTIEAGVLHLSPRPEGKGPFLPIDAFFHSLAKDRGSLAVGIILSGSGTDGTLGFQAIKAEGGLTFAQDVTAPHEGMPHSAVLSGYVDFVLPPEQIAQELIRLGQHSHWIDSSTASCNSESISEEATALATLFRLLQEASGTDFANYKRSTILRRIHRRLAVHLLDRVQDYVQLLRENPDELTILKQDLLIHVTRFFRDPETFEALATAVFPALLRDRQPDVPIRVWVAGCSTGEEVYSLAICLMEFLGESSTAPTIKMFATDVSELALDKARTGRYPASIAAEVSPERLRRFFIPSEGGYQISKSIRDLCVFARHDMTRDPPFSNLDLISCRNVLIYLSPVLQNRVWPFFHYALKNQGFLLLGNSETIGNLPEHFTVIDSKQRIFAKKMYHGRLPLNATFREPLFDTPLTSRHSVRQVVSDQEIQREVERRLAARYAPAGVVINDGLEILQFRGETGRFLAPAPGAASLSLLKMAREGLLMDLRSAIEEAQRTGATTRREGLQVRTDGPVVDLNIQVIPVVLDKLRCFAVLFEEPQLSHSIADAPAAEKSEISAGTSTDSGVARIQQELSATKEYMQSIIEKYEASNEEMRAANEEILSSNEELQSTNEELQTAKEELQATNEELSTVNEELLHRNREAAQLSDDLNNLLRSVNIPIVMVGHDLRIRRFTPSAGSVLSLIPADVGRPISDIKSKLIDVDLRERIVAMLESLVVHEADVRDQDGRWLHLSIRPYRTQADQIDGAVVSLQDIEALKRSEQAIERARQYAQNILDTVQLPIVVLDADLRVSSANSRFFELFGLNPSKSSGQLLAEFGSRQLDVPALLDQLRQSYELGHSFDGWEFELNLSASESRRMLVYGRQLLLPWQAPPLLLVTFEDITERCRLESQLLESQKMEAIGRLAAGVAHDFNNTLTVIELCSNHFLDDAEQNSDGLEMVREISNAAKRAAKLTQQLLAFSSDQIVVPKPLNLNELLVKTEPMLRSVIGERIQLRTILAVDLGIVVADANLIEQAILNLSMNARDAMPRGGELTLSTKTVELDDALASKHPGCPRGSYVCVTVGDTGCGIDQDKIAHIFEPFFTTKEFGSSFGLGLASVYGGIKQSGGFIEVQSQPDQGTEFAIYLPSSPPGASVKPETVSLVPASEGTETILLVEDADDLRKLLKLVLEKAGYTILEAVDGVDALEVAARYQEPIHVLVTDLVMPRMDGMQLAKKLVAARPNLQILLISGYAATADVEATVSQLKATFMQKPFSPDFLSQRIRKMLAGTVA